MLATRIIPTLLCRGRQLIKGTQFNGWRSCGLVMQAARIHGMRAVDELVLLDIDATKEGRGPDLDLVAELALNMATPLAIGGGIRSIGDIDALLRAGADKVVINTALWEKIGLLQDAARHFGSQAIVAALDVKRSHPAFRCGEYVIEDTPRNVARALESSGAGEILLTSIDNEGMMTGYDLTTINIVSEAVSIPIIAHGGCGSYVDMHNAIKAGANAVAAGALFQFTDATPAEAARYLHEMGVEVRIQAAA